MIVTFCGHGNVANKSNVQEWLYSATENLILKGAKTFYLGGYGEFDSLAKSVLREHKKCHSHIDIVLILPYLNSSIAKTLEFAQRKKKQIILYVPNKEVEKTKEN